MVTKKKSPYTLLRRSLVIATFLFVLTSCGSSRKVVVTNTKSKEYIKEGVNSSNPNKNEKRYLTNKEKIEKYIDQFSNVANAEMKEYGIPASITLAQGILESGMGYGRLAKEGNNHFGIKCHSDWQGKRIYHDDDVMGECFRVYKDPNHSYRDHSIFLKERTRYDFLFDINPSNYKAWAKGLKKAGYATDPSYPDKLISLIERFELTRFDAKIPKASTALKPKNGITSELIHKVRKGDTLYSLSKQYNISLDKLVEINQIKDQIIYLGQELKIPIKN